jgi:hypothetical protein
MYPGNFVYPTKSLMLINKMRSPMDVLNIIKSYIFYDMKSLKFAKKVASKKEEITQEVKDSKKITANGYWGLQLKPRYQQKAQFQGYNCNICGEYTLVLWKKYKKMKSTLPICFCSDEDY